MWLYVPNTATSSACALVAPASISESSWQCHALARSVSWRGKLSPSRTWSQRCSKVSWLKLLFGAMSPPSTADRGVALWMDSLAASHASLTASPASGSPRTTSATSGPTRDASSSSPARGSSSSRTSAAWSRRAASNGYGETFDGLVSRLSRDCLQRQKSARRINASGCSSSQWLTVSTEDGKAVGDIEHEMMTRHAAGESVPDTYKRLRSQVSAWPTPTANDWKGSGPTLERKDGQMRGDRLDYATEQLWYTPNVPNGGRVLSSDTSPTGITADGIKRQVGLENQAGYWPTIRAHEVGNYQYSRGDKSKPVETLTGKSVSFHLAHPTYQVGETSSHPRRSLNPLFVEWLMGWPPGWTLLAWTDFACSATALSAWKARMRSALLQLGLPEEAPPVQHDLFA